MPWLAEAFRREFPHVEFDSFLDAITETTAELIRARPPDHLEVSSRLRFERALSRIGVEPPRVAIGAQVLSSTHMAHLGSLIDLPDGHLDLLAELSARFRLGLVSNFDHAPTARAILDRFRLSPFLEAVLISDEFGRRKPHPAIFREALSRLQVDADDAIYVGDSPGDDIAGATAAGLRVVWVNATGRALPEGHPTPAAIITSLPELRDVLSM